VWSFAAIFAVVTAGCASGRQDDQRLAPASRSLRASPDAGGGQSIARARGRSAGCGKAASGKDAFEQRTAQLRTGMRTYHVRVPSTYDAGRAYPLVFRWHGWGGTGLSEGLDIEVAAKEEAIIVAPDGRDRGWRFSSGTEDLALFDAMYESLTGSYCVDLGRVFSYGFSAGGSVTYALACLRAEQLRGVAVIAAFNVPIPCNAPIAAWLQHDRDDDAVALSHGEAARDRLLARNQCSERTAAAGNCKRYLGCMDGFPVVWCETRGLGHNIAGDTAPAQVWRFFSELR
jgi:polyhydroxybutyrate depolymerase